MAHVFCYLFPSIVDTTPLRYERTSFVETGIDCVMFGLWLAGPIHLLIFEPRGPASWMGAIIIGLLASVFYFYTAYAGIKDLLKPSTNDPIMFARGNWIR